MKVRDILIILGVIVALMVISLLYAQWAESQCHARGGVMDGHGTCFAPGVLR